MTSLSGKPLPIISMEYIDEEGERDKLYFGLSDTPEDFGVNTGFFIKYTILNRNDELIEEQYVHLDGYFLLRICDDGLICHSNIGCEGEFVSPSVDLSGRLGHLKVIGVDLV